MKSGRTNRFILSLLAVLSLFVASAAACACSHHQEKTVETETSHCHEHSSEKNVERHHEADSAPEMSPAFSESECVCFQIAPKVFAQTENIKVEQHVAAIPFIKPAKIAFSRPIIAVKIAFFKPSYLSDSFHNLSPGRAPPRL